MKVEIDVQINNKDQVKIDGQTDENRQIERDR